MSAAAKPDDQWSDLQLLLGRLTTMARVIEQASDDLPRDCNPQLYRHCAEVIHETAEKAIDMAEAAEIASRAAAREAQA